MSKQSRILVLFPILLLLLRTFVPAVQGQLNTPEWSSKSDLDVSFQDRRLPADGASLSNPSKNRVDRLYWPSGAITSPGVSARDLINSVPMLKNGRFQQSPNLFLLSNAQRQPLRLSSWSELDANTGNLYKALQQERASSTNDGGTGLDYPIDDIAQQIQPEYPSPSSDDYMKPPSSKSVKPRLARLSRYLVFSNLKRNLARDGYMCHFKLCQVGVSGKRLSM